jgi:hypothetical protein
VASGAFGNNSGPANLFFILRTTKVRPRPSACHVSRTPGSFWYAVILWSVVAVLVLAYGVALVVDAIKKLG